MKQKIFILIITMLFAMFLFIANAQTAQIKILNMKSPKTLVAFFSRANENYAVGYIEKGNTSIIAEIIAAETNGDLFHIEPVKPYPENYLECTEIAKIELKNQARPAIKGDIAVEDYDIIFIGYPNWWGDMPMPVYTFIEKHCWQGKTIVPFCTHEGSGIHGTENKLKTACKGATLLKGFAMQGSKVQNEPDKAKENVKNWLSELK